MWTRFPKPHQELSLPWIKNPFNDPLAKDWTQKVYPEMCEYTEANIGFNQQIPLFRTLSEFKIKNSNLREEVLFTCANLGDALKIYWRMKKLRFTVTGASGYYYKYVSVGNYQKVNVNCSPMTRDLTLRGIVYDRLTQEQRDRIRFPQEEKDALTWRLRPTRFIEMHDGYPDPDYVIKDTNPAEVILANDWRGEIGSAVMRLRGIIFLSDSRQFLIIGSGNAMDGADINSVSGHPQLAIVSVRLGTTFNVGSTLHQVESAPISGMPGAVINYEKMIYQLGTPGSLSYSYKTSGSLTNVSIELSKLDESPFI